MPRAGLTASSVVDAAAVLIDAGGYEALSLSALADSVGVRTPSLYKHVASLDDLRSKLARRAYSELGAVMAAAVVGKSRAEAVESMARAYRDFSRQRPGLAAAAQRAPRGDEHAAAAAQAATDVLLSVIGSYGIRSETQLVHRARFARSAMQGFVSLEAAGGFGMPESIEESFSYLIAAIDAALSAP